jgi:hypothetical protein
MGTGKGTHIAPIATNAPPPAATFALFILPFVVLDNDDDDDDDDDVDDVDDDDDIDVDDESS